MVKCAIEAHALELSGTKLVLFVDNMPGVFMLKSFATKSTLCLRQVKAIFALLTQYNIVLDVRWVSTHNNVADLPSRILLKHVYSLPDWLLFDIKRRFVPTL